MCEEYFFKHFPAGIALSAALRGAGGPAQYAVTTHPWLVHEFYDDAADCARTARNSSMLAMMDAAIARGDVRWHGKPVRRPSRPLANERNELSLAHTGGYFSFARIFLTPAPPSSPPQTPFSFCR